MMLWSSALLAALSLSKGALALEVGDILCVEGFVMDLFCIERTTLLGKSWPTVLHYGYLLSLFIINHTSAYSTLTSSFKFISKF
jgi:hypothetical protein